MSKKCYDRIHRNTLICKTKCYKPCKVAAVCCYAAGEILKMTQIARGLDKDGVLQIDIIVNGKVPELPEGVDLKVLPYREKYIQTGPGMS